MTDRYLHGYSAEESARLRAQARTLAFFTHDDLPFAGARRLLEVGCGVGAQTELLLGAFPGLRVTGVDVVASQLAQAAAFLGPLAARADLVHADATRLPFPGATFDAAYLCWVLEHVHDPGRVLAEVHRTLAPGAPVLVTEVLNHSLFVAPEAPATLAVWNAINQRQLALRGDPHVGARLGNLLLAAGFRDIDVRARHIHLDDRDPARRAEIAAYWRGLMMSAVPGLLAEGRVERATVDAMAAEVERIARGPGSVFFYTPIQARARA